MIKKIQLKEITENIIINKFLKKLNLKNKNSLNFENDGGILNYSKNLLVVSNDTIVEKIHFFSVENSKSIALKAIRSNLSDLISMGAKPYAYVMSLTLNKKIDFKWLNNFTNTLFKEQKKI